MADIDDEVLAYAMALGAHYYLREPMSGKGKKKEWREYKLEVTDMLNGVTLHHTSAVAHFVARLFSDRSATVKKISGNKTQSDWLLVDGRTGLQLRFRAPSVSDVRARMAEAEALEAPSGLVAVESAKQLLHSIEQKRNRDVVQSRAAERAWPPAEGSKAARALALARAGGEFEHSRWVSQGAGWSHNKPSSAAAFIAKLKDRSLNIREVVEHSHDSYKGRGMDLAPGQVYVEVDFCAWDDVKNSSISSYEWVAKLDEAAPPKKKFRSDTKSAPRAVKAKAHGEV